MKSSLETARRRTELLIPDGEALALTCLNQPEHLIQVNDDQASVLLDFGWGLSGRKEKAMVRPSRFGEVPLEELVSDPIVRLVMRSDRVTWDALMGAIETARARLSEEHLEGELEMHE